MTPPIRTLVLIDAFRMGGAETLLAPMIAASRGSDIVMDVVSVSPEEFNSEKTMSILAEAGIPTRSLGIRRLLDPVALPRLTKFIRQGGYDIVHAHLEMAMTLAVPAAALARRARGVHLPPRGRPAGWSGGVARTARRRGRHPVLPGSVRLGGIAALLPGGVPAARDAGQLGGAAQRNRPDELHPGPADPAVRAELGGGPGPMVVLPGAFREFKGIPVAIRAWPRVLQRFPDAVLSLVGGGAHEPELRALVNGLGLEDSVLFAGVRTDMPQVYRAADVVLVPSIYGENFPTVLIEASATARPIAASRVGGIPDIVLEDTTGLLFEAGSEDGLAEAVCRLLGDRELGDRLGAAARDRACSEFSATVWLDRLRALYLQAMGDRR